MLFGKESINASPNYLYVGISFLSTQSRIRLFLQLNGGMDKVKQVKCNRLYTV